MSNYFVVNAPSNLIETVVSLKTRPTDTKLKTFVRANDASIKLLDKWMLRNPGLLMDIGDLMSRSEYIKDRVAQGRNSKATPQRIYYRGEQNEKNADRLQTVMDWIADNPTADVLDLADEFGMGTIAAKAYLLRFKA